MVKLPNINQALESIEQEINGLCKNLNSKSVTEKDLHELLQRLSKHRQVITDALHSINSDQEKSELSETETSAHILNNINKLQKDLEKDPQVQKYLAEFLHALNLAKDRMEQTLKDIKSYLKVVPVDPSKDGGSGSR